MDDQPVLICSDDGVGAALLGALVETLGYRVRFAIVPAEAESLFRRERPRVALVDGEDRAHCSDAFLGRARMRGVSVTIYGTRDTIDRIRSLAEAHDLSTLLMPSTPQALRPVLEGAPA